MMAEKEFERIRGRLAIFAYSSMVLDLEGFLVWIEQAEDGAELEAVKQMALAVKGVQDLAWTQMIARAAQGA